MDKAQCGTARVGLSLDGLQPLDCGDIFCDPPLEAVLMQLVNAVPQYKVSTLDGSITTQSINHNCFFVINSLGQSRFFFLVDCCDD